MTQSERITELEKRLARAEARIAQLEAQPAQYVPYPQPYPVYPARPWPQPFVTFSCLGVQDCNVSTTRGSIPVISFKGGSQ